MVLRTSRPFKHPKTGVYYFRRVVPIDIRPLVGKWEEKRTLGTKDSAEARKLHAEFASLVEREWSTLRLSDVTSTVGSATTSARPVSKIVSQGAHRPNLVAVGFADETSGAALVPFAGSANGHSGLTLVGLVEGWWREAKVGGTAEATHIKYAGAVSRLAKFLAHNDAAKVTPADIVQFKDYRLSTADPKTGKFLSASTIRSGDLAPLKAVFGWAVNNYHLLSNPAERITLKVGRTQRLRSKAFTDAEALALLTAANGVVRGREGVKAYAAKRWVPWLCAYTGARVGEIVQLRSQDVRKEGSLWVIHITPEAGTVKTNVARTVVLHQHLLDRGFITFVEMSKADYLFINSGSKSEIRRSIYSTTGLLRKTAREIVRDDKVAPNHGWRHRFKTICRDIGVAQRVMDAMQGHAARNDSDNYGEVSLQAQALALSRFPLQG